MKPVTSERLVAKVWHRAYGYSPEDSATGTHRWHTHEGKVTTQNVTGTQVSACTVDQ